MLTKQRQISDDAYIFFPQTNKTDIINALKSFVVLFGSKK
jgi:hypothetical protein